MFKSREQSSGKSLDGSRRGRHISSENEYLNEVRDKEELTERESEGELLKRGRVALVKEKRGFFLESIG